jgi:hypothetical protein
MPIKADWIEFKKENIRLIHPNDTGVYECAKNKKVVYIGKGVLRDRLLKHTEEVRFIGVTHFRKRKINDIDEAVRAEGRLLEEYKKRYDKYPLLNKNKSPDNAPSWYGWR